MLDNPWSLEAEQSVLGGLLIDPSAWDVVSGTLSQDMFFDRAHSLIFGAIAALAGAGKPIDPMMVMQRLTETSDLDDAGGEDYLAELLRTTPGTYNIAAHAGIVRDRYTLRLLALSVRRCAAILNDPGIPLGEKAEAASAAILEASEGASDEVDLFTVKDGLRDLYQKLEADHKRGNGLAGLATGFGDIDKRMSGLKGGEMIVVAARPGKGKTNLGLNIASHVSRGGGRAVFFSMEMSKLELASRMACAEYNIDSGAIANGQWESFSGLLGQFIGVSDSYKLLIDDRAGQTMSRIRVGCKKAKRILGGLDLIVIDYLQLIRGTGPTRYEQVTNISRDIKILAKDFGVPVVCLAQLNRGPATGQTRPKASDLRDSGAIEQDADVVMLIHSEDNEDGTTSDYSEIIFDKIRGGQRGIDVLVNDFSRCRFRTADMHAYRETIQRKENKPRGGGYG